MARPFCSRTFFRFHFSGDFLAGFFFALRNFNLDHSEKKSVAKVKPIVKDDCT